MEWQRYIIPFAAGVAAGAAFVETRLAGAFAAGMFMAMWDPWVIAAFVFGMVVGQFIMARRVEE
jgi:hypothetical protein